MNYLWLLIPIGLIALFFWSTTSMLNQSKRDWAKVEEFKKRGNEVQTIDEVVALYYEIQAARREIYNKYVVKDLLQIEYYLRGLYKGSNLK